MLGLISKKYGSLKGLRLFTCGLSASIVENQGCAVLLRHIFIFLTDFNYTGRLIASSTSAFIFMIINPWVAIGTLWFLFWIALYALILSKTSQPVLIKGYQNLSFSRYSWKLAPGNIIRCNLKKTNLYVTNSFCLSQ